MKDRTNVFVEIDLSFYSALKLISMGPAENPMSANAIAVISARRTILTSGQLAAMKPHI